MKRESTTKPPSTVYSAVRTCNKSVSRQIAAMMFAILLALPAGADTLFVGNNTYNNVEIVGLRSGRVYYITSNGREQNVALEDVRAVEFKAYPDMAKANKAFDKEDFKGAARTLGKIVDQSREPHVQILAGAKLVVSLDRSGQFTEAAERYTELLALDSGPLVASAQPISLPTEDVEREMAVDTLSKLLRNTRDPVGKQYLEKTLVALKSGETTVPDTGNQPRSSLLATKEEQGKDELQQLIDSGQAQETLDEIERLMKQEGVSLPRLLYFRGRALAELGQDKSALLSYMRVVIHYSSTTSKYYGASLIESGKLFAKLKQPRHAKAVWTEALEMHGKNSNEAVEINRLIAGLGRS